MPYKRLYILVEGSDDERFFQYVVKPHFEEEYDTVQINQYAKMTNKKIGNFLKSIHAMKADYLYVTDINNSPCVTKKKDQIKKILNKFVTEDRISVVIREIEGWYLAGLTSTKSKTLKVSNLPPHTNDLTKEQFNSLIPKKFDSRIDFMIEILKLFSMPTAKRKNKSFLYFSKRHLR